MLHQKGTQRIEVIVRKEGGGTAETGAKETTPEDIGSQETTQSTSVFGSKSSQRTKRIIKTNVTHAIAVTKQVADLSFQYWISGLGNRYGDQAYQEQISRDFEIVKDVTGIASSTVMGAVYGAWGGPVGAIIGGVLGLVSSSISTGVKYADRRREFNYKVFKENNSIEYQRARASINLTTGRLR